MRGTRASSLSRTVCGGELADLGLLSCSAVPSTRLSFLSFPGTLT